MDNTYLIKYYLIILLTIFIYMFQSNKKWYTNKFFFYALTVYFPILIFSLHFFIK